MPMDAALHVMNAYAPTAHSANFIFQSYIDLLAKQNQAPGQDVHVVGVVTTTATSGGAATIRAIVLGNATDSTFNGGTLAGGGNTILRDTGAIGFATFAAQYQFFRETLARQALQGILEDVGTTGAYLRYLTVGFVIGAADLTGGVFDAWFHYGSIQDTDPYPSGFTV